MSGLKYSKDHEWVRVEGDIGTVGISDYAQDQLGDVVYVELPEVGRTVAQNEEAAVVESVKAASEVYAPVSGEVVEVNQALEDDPALVNGEPTGGGLVPQAPAERARRAGRADGRGGLRRLRQRPRRRLTASPAGGDEQRLAGRGAHKPTPADREGTIAMTAHDGSLTALEQADAFVGRHIGPRDEDVATMLDAVGYESLDALMDAAVPASIRAEIPADFPESRTERDVLAELAALAGRNRVARSMIGLGYHDTITPPVIQRNILENPGWYTAYTPYQPEISQGRLEALLNFQTMVMDLTGLSCANASLLDEGTAAAEAMHMSHGIARNGSDRFFVSDACLPQTIAVVQTRAEAIGIEVEVGDHRSRAAGRAVLRRPAAIPRDRRRGA